MTRPQIAADDAPTWDDLWFVQQDASNIERMQTGIRTKGAQVPANRPGPGEDDRELAPGARPAPRQVREVVFTSWPGTWMCPAMTFPATRNDHEIALTAVVDSVQSSVLLRSYSVQDNSWPTRAPGPAGTLPDAPVRNGR